MTDQLNNTDPLAAYRVMADEISAQTEGRVDAFVQSVGTAGSIRGVGERLRELNDRVQIVAVEPAESAVLSGGPSGAHKLEQRFLPGAHHLAVSALGSGGFRYPEERRRSPEGCPKDDEAAHWLGRA